MRYGGGMLDPTRLRVFRAVVATGSVAAAASNLEYTPSAVSQHLQALQRETGLVLFERSGRGIVPTAAALRLDASAEPVMAALTRLDGDVADLREGRTGSLSLASIHSAGETWLPVVGRRLIEELPDVLVTLSLTDEPVDGAEVDLRVATEDPTQAPIAVPGHRRHHLLTEAYCVVMPPGHPLATYDQVPLAVLGEHALIDEDLGDSTCGLILRSCYRAAGFSPRYVARVTGHHAALAFVAAGIGVCVLPNLTVARAHGGVEVRPLVDPTPRRSIIALVRESVEATVPVARALAILREVATGPTPSG